MNKDENIVVRIAPSPTGFFHVGTLRAALFNYLYAKHNGGKYFLRIENTDKIRSKKEYEEDILASLKWLGIKHDAFFRQSEHLSDHKIYLQQLIDNGFAYISEEKAKDAEGNETSEMRSIIRFKNKGERVSFHDLIVGDIEVDTTDLGDFVIAKDFDTPLYNFAVVVDDINAGITHVIRGQDHISNTPRQILLYRALGKPTPKFAHVPLIVDADRAKLSKRKHGESVSVKYYKEQGYLPEALINFMVLVGWNPGTEQEIFSMNELVQAFTLEKVQKSAGMFNVEKLDWINREHIKRMSPDKQREEILKYIPESIKNLPLFKDELVEKLIPVSIERISKFSDIKNVFEKEFILFFETPEINLQKLNFKETPSAETKENLTRIANVLQEISESDWNIESIKKSISEYTDNLPKRGPALHPLRYCLSGMENSLDPFTIASILGKKDTIDRISNVLAKF